MKKHLLSCLLVAWCAAAVFAQRTVTGLVIDAAGAPLGGTNVRIKNDSKSGAVADSDGRFSIAVPREGATLIFSYTGFEPFETLLGASNELTVQLAESRVLTDVVVTALGITRSEKSLGYATAQVDGSEIDKVRDPNIVNLLSGRAAGVQVVGSNGNLGGSARVTIRGIKSISGNNQPLFVVDGVPMDNSNFTNEWQTRGGYGQLHESQVDYGSTIQDLNPDDIENISILKGQAAAALYGSRGVNGVVMVTTKKGATKRKGIGVSINSSLTFDQVAVRPRFQNKYGGGVNLLPRGYADGSGFYKTPLLEIGEAGDTIGSFSSFDLVPIYAVDESNGLKFATSTDEHFQSLQDGGGYLFPSGFGANQSNLNFRDWNSWDAWDSQNFGKSRVWEAGDDPFSFFETGISSSHNIALEGAGAGGAAFRLSFTRFDQKGILPNSHLERNTLSFNGSLPVGKKLEAFVGANYVNSATLGRASSTYDGRGGTNPASNFSQWWHTELRFDDLKNYENPDGTLRTWNRQSADNPRPQFWDNPYWSRYKNYQNDGRDRIFGNVGLTWKINSWLTATGRVLTDFYNEKREERIATSSLTIAQYTQDLIKVGENNADLILRGNHRFSEKWTLDAFVGGNQMRRKSDRSFGATVGGLSVPGLYRLQNSISRPIAENTTTEKRINSFFGGATLGWKNALYLDLTGRQDWSSALPDDANGYFYPSASVSWVFSEMMKIPSLSFGKARLGWASVGGDTDPYNIFLAYGSDPNFGNLPSYFLPNRLNNSGLRPEKTRSVEGGLDLRFFQNRLGLDLTAYSGTTTDQIVPLATSAATGYVQQFINTGEISNRGIEIEFSATPVRRGAFSWDFGLNFGKNVNRVVSLIPDDPSIKSLPLADAIFGGASVHAQIGQPYGTILGTNYLFDDAGNRLVGPDGFYLTSPGIMPIGNITPDFTGGATNTFSFKNWSLRVFIDVRKGGDIFSVTNMWGRYSGLFEATAEGDDREKGELNAGVIAEVDADGLPIQTGGQATDDLRDDTYKSTGKTNDVRANSYANRFAAGGYVLNAADVYDGSFIKLREVSLGWSLPKKWLGKGHFQSASISVVGRNLAILFKNLPNLDPDMAIHTGNVQGLEGGAGPTTRSLGVNLNLKF